MCLYQTKCFVDIVSDRWPESFYHDAGSVMTIGKREQFGLPDQIVFLLTNRQFMSVFCFLRERALAHRVRAAKTRAQKRG